MQRAAGAAAGLGVATQLQHLRAQVGARLVALAGARGEQRLQVGRVQVFGHVAKAALAVIASLDEGVEYIDGVLVVHGEGLSGCQ